LPHSQILVPFKPGKGMTLRELNPIRVGVGGALGKQMPYNYPIGFYFMFWFSPLRMEITVIARKSRMAASFNSPPHMRPACQLP
jgi:hypothetical protein